MMIDDIEIPREPIHPETIEDKARKYDNIAKLLWVMSEGGNPIQSTFAAALIRELGIGGPDGEDPDDA